MRFASRAGAIARKEVRQLRRDRLTFGMIVGVPVMQLILFGYAINQDVRHLRAGVADLAGTQQARLLVADAEATQVIDVVERARDAEELEDLLRRGRIAVGILIPHDFERRLDQPARPAAQLLVDGSDPIVLAAARGLQSLPTGRAPSADGRAPPARFEVRAYYNPERRSAVQIVPALIGVILTMTMVLFTAVAVVRERERGNLELLITTPVTRSELMVGKLLPYMFIGLVQVSLVLLLGSLLFRVPIRGTLPDVYAAALVFVVASLSLGLLISTLADTQFQAFQLTFFSFLPQILLSGFMFPFDGMPRPAQWIGEVLPLTHFIRMMRGILLRGADLGELTPEIWPLLLFFAVTVSLAVSRFQKRLG
jgi:ABC-2 type transport system permease protein